MNLGFNFIAYKKDLWVRFLRAKYKCMKVILDELRGDNYSQLWKGISKEGRKIVKVKDLKPKRIKGYLEYKFSQRSPALLKYLLFNDF
ncbi:hypothetical protein GQ457_15G012670 [Hibiscus cannabinus]